MEHLNAFLVDHNYYRPSDGRSFACAYLIVRFMSKPFSFILYDSSNLQMVKTSAWAVLVKYLVSRNFAV